MSFLELKVPPPLQVLVVGAAMYSASKMLPAWQFRFTGSSVLAGGLAIVGLGIAVMGVNEFKKAQTTVNPHIPNNATSLVTRGIYQYTRNPMYLGLSLALLGWAVYLSNGSAFILLPVFVIYISRFQIQPEEKVMMQKFGNNYRDYKARVRRWL